MKRGNNFIRLLLMSTVLLGSIAGYSQIETIGGGSSGVTISGASIVNANSTHSYTVNPQQVNTLGGSWTVLGASILSQTSTSVTVQWTSAGVKTLEYQTPNVQGSLSVTVNAIIGPHVPPNPTIANKDCSSASLQMSGTPPLGVTWYWQGKNSNGTNTSLPTTNNYSLTTSGTYYVRARNSNNIWSTGSGSVVVVLQSNTTWYADTDGDGLGDPNVSIVQCNKPLGYVSNNNDQCPKIYGGGTANGCPPAGQAFGNENYIHTVTYTEEFTQSQVDGNVPNDQQKVETINYFDGLGRPKQSIGIGQSPLQNDIVTHMEYDDLGRQTKEYLSYASTTNTGSFHSNALSETKSYYKTKYADDFTGIATQNINPYSEKGIENSPLNRVVEQTAPGNAWEMGTNILSKGYSDGQSIKFEYDTNANNEVRSYKVSTSFANNTYTPTLTGGTTYYQPAQLYKKITKDENWTIADGLSKTTEEFKNRQGQVILKRTYVSTGAAIPEAHDTYYVYDTYGNLTYVLPPKVNTADGVSTVELIELCYQYKYDDKNRLVEKKIPGKEWEYIVYDKLDRPILTQDANLRATKDWLFTKYDILGRVAYTGTFYNGRSRLTMQPLFEDDTPGNMYEDQTGTTIMIDGIDLKYTNKSYPTYGIHMKIHTINYYDDYNFDRAGTGTSVNVYGTSSSQSTKGLATGTKVRVLGTDDWITTVNYYDEKGRSIYVYTKNDYLQTTDIVESKLDFTGKVLETITTHQKAGQSSIVTIDYFEYDHAGRLLSQTQKINNQPTEQIVKNTYDELGQLQTKRVGGKTHQTGLQNIDYRYNVRGWLKSINWDTKNDNDLFNFGLRYNDSTSSTPLFNGNISQVSWYTLNTDPGIKTYTYSYDALNRITTAIDNTGNYNLNAITYDKNGNILTLQRKGQTNSNATTFGIMDNLSYTYNSHSNQLKKVLDNANDLYGFKDAHNANTEYTYDDNGNMISDANKGITRINYNHLNLPIKVVFNNSSTQTISYRYATDGSKLRKVTNDNGVITRTDYAGNYIYKNTVLQFFNHAEGYIQNNNGIFRYVYQYKDHLGNIRLSYADSNNDGQVSQNEIIEEVNYYPFGLKHRGYNNVVNGTHHPYGFLNQEENEELGLGWLTFRYRNYIPEIGRFFGSDPISEEFFSISNYQFAHNSPIWKIELEGLEGEISPKIPNAVDIPNKEPIKRTVTILGVPTFKQDNRTPEQRKKDRLDQPRRKAKYERKQKLKKMGPPANYVGAERSKFIMTGVAHGMADVMTGAVIGKVFKGAKLLRTIGSSSKKADNTVVVMGQGMDRVKDAQGALLKNGVDKVEIFKPSKPALKEWNKLISGGKHLSDDIVKGTKLYKENVKWINDINKSGKTILDIGGNGSGKTSTFYEMEKSIIYGTK